MLSGSLKLEKILNIPKWQSLQDSFAQVTGLAIITVDYKGVPITRHSGRSEFCSHIRQHPEYYSYCQKCDAHAGLEAVRISKPYVYLCHCNVVDVAIPIMIDDKYIGAIMAGQVRLKEKSDMKKLVKILLSPNRKFCNTAVYRTLYAQLPVMTLDHLHTSINLLFELCNYIVEEAINKNLVLDMYDRILGTKSIGMIPENHPAEGIETIRRDLSEAVTNAYIRNNAEIKNACTNKLLQPAFDYLNQHKGEILSQKNAAELCHISPGHFSRLFVKETNENYSNFYSRQKIDWAKQLLEKTDLSITQISHELGYNEPGYFIKTFRKYEGITPAAYRRYLTEHT